MAIHAISPENRIRELNEISGGMATMLNHVGLAINALSPNAQESEGPIARKEAFDSNMRSALEDIQAFSARMKRQAYALEEAAIIAAEAPTLSATSTQQQSAATGRNATAATEPERITNGGLGNLDVGLLNSRGNKVGLEKEAELLQEAKALLEDELEKRRGPEAGIR